MRKTVFKAVIGCHGHHGGVLAHRGKHSTDFLRILGRRHLMQAKIEQGEFKLAQQGKGRLEIPGRQQTLPERLREGFAGLKMAA